MFLHSTCCQKKPMSIRKTLKPYRYEYKHFKIKINEVIKMIYPAEGLRILQENFATQIVPYKQKLYPLVPKKQTPLWRRRTAACLIYSRRYLSIYVDEQNNNTFSSPLNSSVNLLQSSYTKYIPYNFFCLKVFYPNRRKNTNNSSRR